MVDPKETREEQKFESVTLKRGTLIGGDWYDAGDSVDVYPFQKRHLVGGNYVEGSVYEEFSPGEMAHGADNVLKKAEDRNDMDVAPSVDEMFNQHDVGQGVEGEGSEQSSSKSSKSSSKSSE